MNANEIKGFCDAWIFDEPSAEELADGDADYSDVTLRGSWLDFDHAGRYSLKFRNQGFNTGDFGKWDYSEEGGTKLCPLWNYVTSPDVNYYDAEFKTESRPAYDVALYAETFAKSADFTEMSNALGELFDLVRRRDYKALAAWNPGRTGISFGKDGTVEVDGDKYDLILTVKVFPHG